MKPEVDQILRFTASQLMTGLAPQLADSYAQSSAGLLGFMLVLSAQEFDRAADIRARENADIRATFAALGPRVADKTLRALLAEESQAKDESLAVSSLNEANYRLRRLLISLQTAIETANDKDAQKQVWSLLQAMAARRLVAPPI